MALPATEAFTYTNGTELTAGNASWTRATATNGAILIQSNQAYPHNPGSAPAAAYHWNADAFANDQYAKLTITAVGSSANHLYTGVSVRKNTSAANKHRYLWVGSGADRYLAVNDGTTETGLGEDSAAQVVNDVWELDAVGTTITGKINGVTIFSVTDSTLAAGAAGLDFYSDGAETETNALVDSWEGGNIAAGGATLSARIGEPPCDHSVIL